MFYDHDDEHNRERLLVISPVRNEAAHIERVVAAMAAQTRPPDLWLVADDGSEDDTLRILGRLEREVAFLRVLALPPRALAATDRLALALEARAFNAALGEVDWRDFTHLGKLDGDMELPADYFQRALAAFAGDPALGIAGGSIVEPTGRGGAWRRVKVPGYHVHGALKLYSRACFEAVGGVQERLGWDTIDETYARMHGFRTAHLAELVVRHHRPAGNADGKLRGRVRAGRCASILRYGTGWVLLRSVKMARTSPPGLSGLAFLAGYLGSRRRPGERVEDPRFASFVRRELRGRIVRALLPAPRRRSARVHLTASAGGHLELLANLEDCMSGLEPVWVTSTGARASDLRSRGARVLDLPLFQHRRLGHARNVVAAARLALRERPDMVVTSGAGSVVPFCVFARLLGAELVFIETTARVTSSSAAGRLLAPLASRVIVQWPEMTSVYPGATVCRPPMLDHEDGDPVAGTGTFVAVGSHTDPFDRLLVMVDEAVARGVLPAPVRAQTGVSDYMPHSFDPQPWLTPEQIAEAVRTARYVVCHGGSGLVATALRSGRRPLVCARLQRHGEHVDDHQVQLVDKLAETGLVVPLDGEITTECVSVSEGPVGLTGALQGASMRELLEGTLRAASMETR